MSVTSPGSWTVSSPLFYYDLGVLCAYGLVLISINNGCRDIVELLEKDSRRLMNCAENGLTIVCQLAQEGADCPGALRVETTGRFIQEQKQLRFGCKFHANSQKLPLLDIQAWDIVLA